MAEEEVAAVEAVYGDDCQIIEAYPPHLHVHLKPRTADVSSHQFVEAMIAIRAGSQYPEEPPKISIIDSKGLDYQRQKHLVTCIQNRAFELISCLMLVALCEEAVERLSSMNHPDGNCPLCLYPLLNEDSGDNVQPFMKLMSCFHCFHCDCIIRWWNWTQMQNEKEVTSSSSASTAPTNRRSQLGMQKMTEENMAQCPVCRKVFLAKDIEHVLDLVETNAKLDSVQVEIDEDLLQSEKIRRQQFEAILKLQQENSGLIEPKRNEVLLPGMFLPPSAAVLSAESDINSDDSQNNNPRAQPGTHTGNSFTSRSAPRNHTNSYMKKHRAQNSRKQGRHWIRKDNNPQN